MKPASEGENAPVVLVTGGARRIGAAIAAAFHARGYRLLLHCRVSLAAAEALAAECNARRPASAAVLCADLNEPESARELAGKALARFGRLDVLVNNASSYYPTVFGHVSPAQWEDLQGSNLRGHFFLSQTLAEALRQRRGAIVNITDVHALRPPRDYSAYAIAKAGLAAMTRSLAIELAPEVRVNAIAPGAILWPETPGPEEPGPETPAGESALETTEARKRILQSIPLQTTGTPEQVAALCCFLAAEAHYLTGQTIHLDGGRHLR